MQELIDAAKQVESMGVASVLVVVISGLVWVIRILYLQANKCEGERLKDANERAKMNREIGELCGRVDAMNELHSRHLEEVVRSIRDDRQDQ